MVGETGAALIVMAAFGRSCFRSVWLQTLRRVAVRELEIHNNVLAGLSPKTSQDPKPDRQFHTRRLRNCLIYTHVYACV